MRLPQPKADYKPYGIIYKATLPDGRAYVGQTTTSLKQRISEHKNTSAGHGIFPPLVREYSDRIEWSVLCECRTQSELDAAEIAAIAEHGGELNLRRGGARGKHSPKSCALISAAAKERRLSPQTKAKISASVSVVMTDRWSSAAGRAKMRVAQSAGQKRRWARFRQQRTGLLI